MVEIEEGDSQLAINLKYSKVAKYLYGELLKLRDEFIVNRVENNNLLIITRSKPVLKLLK